MRTLTFCHCELPIHMRTYEMYFLSNEKQLFEIITNNEKSYPPISCRRRLLFLSILERSVCLKTDLFTYFFLSRISFVRLIKTNDLHSRWSTRVPYEMFVGREKQKAQSTSFKLCRYIYMVWSEEVVTVFGR